MASFSVEEEEDQTVELAEELWSLVLCFCELKEVLRCGAVSRLVQRSALCPWLGARRRVCLEEDVDARTLARLVGACGELEVFGARLRGTTEAWRLSLPRTLLKMSLSFREPAGLEYVLYELGVEGRCPLLEFLDVRLEGPGAKASQFLFTTVGLPRLRSLRVDAGAHVTLDLDACLEACAHLETLALPNIRDVAQYRRGSAKKCRVNSESRMFLPPVSIFCGRCGSCIYKKLESFVVGPSTQPHITFELFTDQAPDNAIVVDADTRLNCRRNCHLEEDRFLIAGRGDFVDTKNFNYAIACGRHLARVTASILASDAKLIIDDLFQHEDVLLPPLSFIAANDSSTLPTSSTRGKHSFTNSDWRRTFADWVVSLDFRRRGRL